MILMYEGEEVSDSSACNQFSYFYCTLCQAAENAFVATLVGR